MTLVLQLTLVASLLALAVAVVRYTADPIHPASLLVWLWTLILALYLCTPHALRPIGLETVLLVATSSAAFVLGALAPAQSAPERQPQHFTTTAMRPALFWLAIVGLPLYAMKASELAESAAYTESMLINLRIALTGELDEVQTYGVLGYLVPISFSSTLVELAVSRRRAFEAKGWISLLVSLAYAVLATGRTFVFVLLVSLVFVAVVQGRIARRHLIWAAAISLAVAFFGLGVLFNKIGEDSPNVNALSALDALSLYLLGSLAALDHALDSNMPLDWGLNSFRSIFAVLRSLGLDATVVSLVKDYVYVPEPTNVYTVFLPYIQDFGVAGAVACFAIFGWCHARLYRAAKTLDPRFVILHALAMYALLMQFFQDQYLSLFTFWMVFVVIVFPCFRPVRRMSQPSPG